jgi:hypothetical protein
MNERFLVLFDLRCCAAEKSVVFWPIDIPDYRRIGQRDILKMVSMLVFDLARIGGGWSFQKRFH